MPSRNLPTAAAGDPRSNAQRHFTDPDSHILKGGDGWFQGYNCQAAVDGDQQIIVLWDQQPGLGPAPLRSVAVRLRRSKSPHRSLVRSTGHGAWIASCCEAWRTLMGNGA